nr:hypothetical protein [Streptomyces physcomitrii]
MPSTGTAALRVSLSAVSGRGLLYGAKTAGILGVARLTVLPRSAVAVLSLLIPILLIVFCAVCAAWAALDALAGWWALRWRDA